MLVLREIRNLFSQYKLIFSLIVLAYIYNGKQIYKEVLSTKELDTIVNKLHKDNDSIITSINKNKEELIDININYEKTNDSIINQSVNSDIEFFTNYLSKNCGRLYNCNISDTIKAN